MKTRVVIDTGDKRTFATAVDWPGWSRSGKSGDDALRRLIDYGPRYKGALGAAAKGLTLPRSIDELDVIQTVHGGTNTDFGVPHEILKADLEPLTETQLTDLVKLLKAAWEAFDSVAAAAHGKTLAKGPRGGGRTLEQIREHVHGADRVYIGALGAKAPLEKDGWGATQDAFVEALRAKLRGELPAKGPRGGERWPARYAIRRSAWHSVDHAWEIEDRTS
jgi:hypothetical protein